MRKLNHNFYGVVLLIGLVIHLVTNYFWKPIFGDTELGYKIYFIGQAIGYVAYLLSVRQYFKEKTFFFFLIADLGFNLSITKLFTELFLNPEIYNKGELIGLQLSIIIFIIKLWKRKKKIRYGEL